MSNEELLKILEEIYTKLTTEQQKLRIIDTPGGMVHLEFALSAAIKVLQGGSYS